MSRVRLASTLTALVAALAGCGDSLLGSEGLGSLGDYAGPQRPAWELRWFRGDRQGFTAPCDLEVLDSGQVALDALPYGFVDAPEPTVDAPAVWIDEGDYRYALALVLLVELPRNTGARRLSTATSPLAGVWGAATYHVLLWADGDLDALGRGLALEGAGSLTQGRQVLDLDLPAAPFPGDFDGTLTVPEPVSWELLFPVEVQDTWWEPWEALLGGRSVGGTTFEPCGR